MHQTIIDLQNALKTGKKLQIKLLGDSITHGAGGTGFKQDGEPIVEGFARNPNGFCWAKLFKEHLMNKYSCTVINNACTGTRIEFILRNFNTLVEEKDDFVICMIGTNNRHQYFHEGEKRTREEFGETFYQNILKLNAEFERLSKKVIFMANIPASEKNEQDGKDFWRILHVNDINAIYKRAQEKTGFAFISLYDLFTDYLAKSGEKLDELLYDGLHPNDAGYKVMFALLKDKFGV